MPRGIPEETRNSSRPSVQHRPALAQSVELLERSVTNIGGTTSVLGGAPVFDAPDEEGTFGSSLL